MHCFGIIIKEKCSTFNQGIIQQPIMSINKVITPMTELSEPPSYMYVYVYVCFRFSEVMDHMFLTVRGVVQGSFMSTLGVASVFVHVVLRPGWRA